MPSRNRASKTPYASSPATICPKSSAAEASNRARHSRPSRVTSARSRKLWPSYPLKRSLSRDQRSARSAELDAHGGRSAPARGLVGELELGRPGIRDLEQHEASG